MKLKSPSVYHHIRIQTHPTVLSQMSSVILHNMRLYCAYISSSHTETHRHRCQPTHTGTAVSQHTHNTHQNTHTPRKKHTHQNMHTKTHTHKRRLHFHYQNLLKLSKGSAYIQLYKTKTCHLHSPMCAILFGYFICFGANEDHKAKNKILWQLADLKLCLQRQRSPLIKAQISRWQLERDPAFTRAQLASGLKLRQCHICHQNLRC